jgi:lactate permease
MYSGAMEAILAMIPLAGLILFLVLRWTILQSALASLVIISIIASVFFKLAPDTALASVIKASLIMLDIAIILIGAITFFKVLKSTGIMDGIQQKLLVLTPDHRLQAIMIAWLLGGFVEGLAGFGTPALIVAPLLVTIGFSPFKSILIALLANSTAVTFGAVGTPIRVGFDGLNVENVAGITSTLHLWSGPIVPVMMLLFIVHSKKEGRTRAFFEALPWTIWVSFAFTVPMWVFAKVGQEFASLLGALTGLLLTSISVKLKFLVPQNPWQISKGDNEPGNPEVKVSVPEWLPFLLLIVLLVAGKLFLENANWSLPLPGEKYHALKLFNPGWFFILTLVLLGAFYKDLLRKTAPILKETSLKAIKPLTSIFLIAIFVQVFVNSGMLTSIAVHIKEPTVAYITPFLGAFGSFLTGSATVSNLLIAPLLAEIDGGILSRLLALQLIGAAAGNMISLQNILTIMTAVDCKENEAKALMRLIIPCSLYLSLVLLLSFILFG